MSGKDYYQPFLTYDASKHLIVNFWAPYNNCAVTGTSTTLPPGCTLRDLPQYQEGDLIFVVIVQDNENPQTLDTLMQRLTVYVPDPNGNYLNILVLAKDKEGKDKDKRVLRTTKVH